MVSGGGRGWQGRRGGLPGCPHAGARGSLIFPHCGKKFSTVWKTSSNFFHCVEKSLKLFPLCGKTGSGNLSRDSPHGGRRGFDTAEAGRHSGAAGGRAHGRRQTRILGQPGRRHSGGDRQRGGAGEFRALPGAGGQVRRRGIPDSVPGGVSRGRPADGVGGVVAGALRRRARAQFVAGHFPGAAGVAQGGVPGDARHADAADDFHVLPVRRGVVPGVCVGLPDRPFRAAGHGCGGDRKPFCELCRGRWKRRSVRQRWGGAGAAVPGGLLPGEHGADLSGG